MDRQVADSVGAGEDRARAAPRDQQRVSSRERVFKLVNRHDPASLEHDEEHVQVGVPVLGHLVSGGPRQECRVQVAARRHAAAS
jgi:hypothetical protein